MLQLVSLEGKTCNVSVCKLCGSLLVRHTHVHVYSRVLTAPHISPSVFCIGLIKIQSNFDTRDYFLYSFCRKTLRNTSAYRFKLRYKTYFVVFHSVYPYRQSLLWFQLNAHNRLNIYIYHHLLPTCFGVCYTIFREAIASFALELYIFLRCCYIGCPIKCKI